MIELRTRKELDLMGEAGQIVKEVLEELSKVAKAGVSTKKLERIAEDMIVSRGATAAFKGYKGFPGSICTSINECVVHGIPSERQVLKEGDILSIDVGVRLKGYFADAALTLGIGRIDQEARRLIDVTKEALDVGIGKAVTGNRLSDISSSIQDFVEGNGFSVVRAFVGHGIGKNLHEEPEVPNFGKSGMGVRLEEGMVLAIEPMVNSGTHEVEILDDGWITVTKDRKLSAHFEHTIAVKEKPEILTG